MGLLSDWLRRKRSERQSAEPGPDPAQLEALRLRARHRLVGASVLVLIAVLLLPRVFDGTPRAINSPSRAVTTAAAATAAASVPSAVASPVLPPLASVASAPSRPIVIAGAASAGLPASTAWPPVPRAASVPLRPASAPVLSVVPAPAASGGARRPDPSRAQALLEGRAPAAVAPPSTSHSTASGRYFVQVGAFGNDHAAHDMKGRMERLGMKASEQEVNTASGRRIRVRLGPYGSRDEASAVLVKVRASGVDAALMLQ
jgi:DedD protein